MSVIQAVVCHSCGTIKKLPEHGNPYKLPAGWVRDRNFEDGHTCPDCGGDGGYFLTECAICGELEDFDSKSDARVSGAKHILEHGEDHKITVQNGDNE